MRNIHENLIWRTIGSSGEYKVWFGWAADDATAGQFLTPRAGDAARTHNAAGKGS